MIFMKDRMIIIREEAIFIVTVSHQEHEVREQQKVDINQQNVNLLSIEISAN